MTVLFAPRPTLDTEAQQLLHGGGAVRPTAAHLRALARRYAPLVNAARRLDAEATYQGVTHVAGCACGFCAIRLAVGGLDSAPRAMPPERIHWGGRRCCEEARPVPRTDARRAEMEGCPIHGLTVGSTR